MKPYRSGESDLQALLPSALDGSEYLASPSGHLLSEQDSGTLR
jgi:hypothetical protein